ncbi:transferase, transferring glycosyl group [Trypanosoma rangeli]|uniref:Transferase, transferring glycosyl group n=1 Tax=Trypanosoma rangeli TaxID=5698 RepID=A0A422NFR7_TRYRA|nr:transferase, transferring glycosyl group [Trypanosoma rangeli]RNF04296.1 transferase, transferring glycosyl group [Trypanosoma rangeli]|eukprot:RNF04296.1 transferase, transferring glycosyl group [Trypanosoma rangeli]
MAQTWFRPHPLGIYPRGNARRAEDLSAPRFGSLSLLQFAAKGRRSKLVLVYRPTEEAFLELLLHMLSFAAVDDICRLSATSTGWYCFIHASDTFKQAHSLMSANYLCFRGSWKETAVRAFLLEATDAATFAPNKRHRTEHSNSAADVFRFKHSPVAVSRSFFNDLLFQAWMCTILPCHYHLLPALKDEAGASASPGAARKCEVNSSGNATNFRSLLKDVPRLSGLSPEEFRESFEKPNLPVILTDVATHWPFFKILQGKFENLAQKKEALFRPGASTDVPMRCESTTMTVSDYVRYAQEQSDERPIYMFDAEFGTSMAIESLYSVPEHFARDDFFKVLGDARPKYRWIVAGPRRGGSSFHVDPNYTNAWNANLTGRKRWILFPPGCIPDGVFPTADMSEVTTPVSLSEWLLNYYDACVERWRGVGYECICEPGDIMFIPCGWWHFVINLEDSVAITQNYVSESNLSSVMKFLVAMKSSITGIDEDAEDITSDVVRSRRAHFAEEFAAAMHVTFPDLMQRVESDLEKEMQQRRQKQQECVALPLLDIGEEGFTFNF